MFAFIHRWFADGTVDPDGLSEREIEKAVEKTVDLADARLRLVGNYQRKLRPAVVEALLHARELIHQIPGPVEINRSTYAHDPLVHSLFGAADQLGEVFNLSAEAQAFKKAAWSRGDDHLFGLLLMTMKRKTRPGFALNGDVVQADVIQKIVYFTEHALVKVCASEYAVRTALRERALESMIKEYKLRVAEHALQGEALNREQARLRRDATTQGQQKLAEVERELQALSGRLRHMDDYLDLLVEVLTNPDDHCGLECRELRLDRGGVDQGDDSAGGNRIPYAEVTVGDTQRAGLLVKYPLGELSKVDHLDTLYRMAL